MKKWFLALIAAASMACGTIPIRPPQPNPEPPPACGTAGAAACPDPVRTVALIVLDNATNQPVEGAACVIDNNAPPSPIAGTTSNTGYVAFNGVFASVRQTGIRCQKSGYLDSNWPVTIPVETNYQFPNYFYIVPVQAPLPPYPTRDQLATAQLTFQGLTLHCSDGSYNGPIFDVMLDTISASCRQDFYKVKRAAGDKAIALALSHAYREAGIDPAIAAGHDWSNDLAGLDALIDEVVRAGFYVQLHLAGDGEGAGPGYNDPVGDTYGYQWLMNNLSRIVAGLQPHAGYIRWYPGFDGVFYGWEPSGDKVPTFANTLRGLLPNAVIGIEFNTGHIPIGEGGSDYQPGGRMQNYDIIAAEYGPSMCAPYVYQINGRMTANYLRPACATDDPQNGTGPNRISPLYYLKVPNARGQWYFYCFEWNLYDWVRNNVSAETLQQNRSWLISMGCSIVG